MAVDSDIPNQCGATSIDWALFVLTIISTHVTWWLMPLPALFNGGFKTYVHDVAWECLRLQVPSYTGYVACHRQERVHWQSCYYTGVKKPMTRFGDLKAFFKDSMIVVSTCLALYRLCSKGNQTQDLSGLNSSLWTYPSLPVAIFGLFISIFARTQVKPWIVAASSIFFLILIAVTLALIIHFTYGHGIWVPCTMFILYMSIPLWAFIPRMLGFVGLLATLLRVGGPIIGAVSPRAYFPFCAVRGWGFSGTLIAFSVIGWILGVYGMTLVPREDKPNVAQEEPKEIP